MNLPTVPNETLEAIEAQWELAKQQITLVNCTNTTTSELATFRTTLQSEVARSVHECRKERKRARAHTTSVDLSDESMFKAARFTDSLALSNYNNILHLVPRLVNVVTLAEAIPAVGSGLKLPLNLHAIGARCSNAYFAPKRFAAVQLAFSNPRCRVLIFHTGRLVGTGCSGPMAARLSIMKAARQLAIEADVHVVIRKFQVINQAHLCNLNTHVITSRTQGLRYLSTLKTLLRLFVQVGAVSIDARLDCDAFASTHSASSHYDRASFVGLAWRPGGEYICCEIYGTGKANLPGSTRQRDLLASFSRMVSELLRHSDRSEMRLKLQPHLRLCHRPRAVTRDDAPASSTTQVRVEPTLAIQQPPPTLSNLFDETWAMPALAVAMPTTAAGQSSHDTLSMAEFFG